MISTKQTTLSLFALALLLLACDNNTASSKLGTQENVVNMPNTIHNTKIAIDFQQNKVLLDILLLLPDSAFDSWDWELSDRQRWYNEIKENNAYTDENPEFFNQLYFEPSKAKFSIVDGTWSINLYKANDNAYIVVTNDHVGDGNKLSIYEVQGGHIQNSFNEKTFISNFTKNIKKQDTNQNCNDTFNELNNPIYEFDFSNNDKIEIESSWYLTKEKYESCLNGNAVLFNFNPKTKKFDIEKIYWKPVNKG